MVRDTRHDTISRRSAANAITATSSIRNTPQSGRWQAAGDVRGITAGRRQDIRTSTTPRSSQSTSSRSKGRPGGRRSRIHWRSDQSGELGEFHNGSVGRRTKPAYGAVARHGAAPVAGRSGPTGRRMRDSRAACRIVDLPMYSTGAGSACEPPPGQPANTRSVAIGITATSDGALLKALVPGDCRGARCRRRPSVMLLSGNRRGV
jgi:hypothetical protein